MPQKSESGAAFLPTLAACGVHFTNLPVCCRTCFCVTRDIRPCAVQQASSYLIEAVLPQTMTNKSACLAGLSTLACRLEWYHTAVERATAGAIRATVSVPIQSSQNGRRLRNMRFVMVRSLDSGSSSAPVVYVDCIPPDAPGICHDRSSL